MLNTEWSRTTQTDELTKSLKQSEIDLKIRSWTQAKVPLQLHITHHAQGQDADHNRTKGEGDKSRTASTEDNENGGRTSFAITHQTHTAIA